MSTTPENAAEAASGTRQGQFLIQRIYVKDLSFETPHSPHIFQKAWQPAVNLDLATTAGALDEANYEVVLSITVTVTIENQTVYLVEVQQAGIFRIVDVPKELIGRMLATVCPNILFPFARETVSDLVTRGGFPQLLLAPVNFDALFLQQQQRANEAAGAPAATGTVQ